MINYWAMDLNFWTELLTEAYAQGFKKAIEASGGLPAYLSKNKAYSIYRRKRVEFWINKKLITPIPVSGKRNGEVQLSRERLELLDSLSYVDCEYGVVPPEQLPPAHE